MLKGTGRRYYERTVKTNKPEETLDVKTVVKYFVDPSRIEDLRSINGKKFDFSKLIRLCEEINDCYSHKNFYAVAMILISIIDHIPPVFGFKNFAEIASN